MSDEFSNAFAESLTAGLKFRSMQEDLTRARLEREEWQTKAGYRMRMEELAQKRGEAELASNELQKQLTQHQLERSTAEQGPALELLKAQTGAQTANAEESRANAGLRGAQQKEVETDTTLKQLNAAGFFGAGAGRQSQLNNKELNLNEISSLADNLMETLGVKNTPAVKSIYVNKLYSDALGAQKELAEHDLANTRSRLEEDQKQASQIAQTALQFDNPQAVVEGMSSLYKDNPRVLEFAKSMTNQAVGQLDRLSRQALAKEVASFRDQRTEELNKAIAFEEQRVARLESKGGKLEQKEKLDLETSKKTIEKLKGSLSSYMKDRFPGLATSSVGASNSGGLSNVELQVLPDWFTEATDKELEAIAKAKKIPLEKLKFERDRRLKNGEK